MATAPEGRGGPGVLVPVDRSTPRPGADELLIRGAAAGINRPDVLQRKGAYPPPPGAPSILGLEIAGEVVALGAGVDDALLGQRVCALVAGGGYAQYAVAPAGQCLPVPQALRSEEHTSELQSLMRISYAVFCLKKKKKQV